MKNLKFIIAFVVLTFAFTSTQAQIAIGPKIGINFSNLGGDGTEGSDTNSLLGFQLGATAQINLSENFAIAPELLYWKKGGSASEDFLGVEIEVDQALNYLEIPVLAKYMFGDEGSTRFYVSGGPSFGIGLNTRVKTSFGDGDEDSAEASFDEAGLSVFDFSLSLGGGIHLPLGPGTLLFDARYLFGLSSITDGDLPGADDLDVQNRGISVSAGYLFTLGK